MDLKISYELSEEKLSTASKNAKKIKNLLNPAKAGFLYLSHSRICKSGIGLRVYGGC